MSIPLDRLYHHIDRLSQSLCGGGLIIYRFFPHGSKNIKDLTSLQFEMHSKPWAEWQTSPVLLCHDQEPLEYDLYQDKNITKYLHERYADINHKHYFIDTIAQMNLRAAIYYPLNCYDVSMLTHSEKNSKQVSTYENNGMVGVYWWSHAVIARDWFRYAEHIQQRKNVVNTFLIYNRAWGGTREYRLKFSELLIESNLQQHCQTKINVVEPELQIHYLQHNFKNNIWKPQISLDNYFPSNSVDSSTSADFELADYQSTDIEVVLETLFDDSRWHLTEKTLRPIALEQPFILAGTCGSLEYLRSYGFKTFDTVWSENYDLIADPYDRLTEIIKLMKSITEWSSSQRQQKMQQIKQITDHNKKLFFSKAWQDSIFDEYQQNFKSAWEVMKANRTGKHFIKLREHAKVNEEWNKILNSDLPWRTQEDVGRVLEWIKNPT